MDHLISVIGLDVHKDSVTAAVLRPGAEQPTATLTVEASPGAFKRFAKRLGPAERLEFVYEAGACGYEVHRWLTGLGYRCTVVRYLRCLKGVDTLCALTFAVEAQDFRRFVSAPAFMAYTGLVPSEHSSGESVQRGGITKSGNTHLRRVLVEAAWCNRQGIGVSAALRARREGCPEAVLQIARRAQDRLRRKFWKMTARGKPHTVAVAAVARELAGFVWAIGQLAPAAA